jgi:hypothetical protein
METMRGLLAMFRAPREFFDLHDVNRQARQWLAEVANRCLHRETDRLFGAIAVALCN